MRFRLLDDLLALLNRHGRAGRQDLSVLAEALLSGRGEASGVVLAHEILAVYAGLDPERKLAFLNLLAERYAADPVRLERAITAYQHHPGPKTAAALHTAAEARRQELIRRLNLATGGTDGLVKMREDLLRSLPEHPELEAVDTDFVHLLSSWFNRGFLVLRRIDWSTPAHILEKIIRYEAVHAITSWDDLRRRLEPADRRCFAFFHPALVDEPLIFVEVALTAEIPGAIAPLLAEGRRPLPAKRATTAVFYSTSNTQLGLKGISFGAFLIKQVAEELTRELPSLRTFVTLSPVPGFGAWLRHERDLRHPGLLTAEERHALRALDQPGWFENPQAVRAVKPALLTAVARYLLDAKGASGKPLDSVARFHLGNGARLERINWLGDTSSTGLFRGAGFMVNYLYDLALIERNHELYANRGEVVTSLAVRKILRPSRSGKS